MTTYKRSVKKYDLHALRRRNVLIIDLWTAAGKPAVVLLRGIGPAEGAGARGNKPPAMRVRVVG